ncbi:translation initiation factor IF-2 [Anaerotignum neopropionicum]|uniref:Translation initiation factor IF-2 n=1 Tax=Anaerotignum neopropionicum TaxID=36847 RepID=A0A136WDF4_9FIRM|nr:translation initiation factor IF-2 [Anaerotignum neopropionicum]KXL52547.1 translation initiation factor IF-2 [Anaerotignum neopropionicum]
MSKTRIYELAKELGVSNKDLMGKLQGMGVEVSSHMGVLDANIVEKVKGLYRPKVEAVEKEIVKKGNVDSKNTQAKHEKSDKPFHKKDESKKEVIKKEENKNEPNKKEPNKNEAVKTNVEKKSGAPKPKSGGNKKDDKNKKGNKKDQKVRENPMERRRREREEEAALMAELEALEAAERAANPNPVMKTIPETITVKDLAEVIGKKGSDLVMNLMKKGKMLTINALLDFDTAATIAQEYNVILEKEEEKDIMETVFAEEVEDDSVLEERPPVVVVMGHVDHGKTSLLDAIRHSSVTKGEAGGITQHIGAYTVQIGGKPITFLDTPGHEAFTAMRMRGAQITDIAILVVAADDGVMPQTVEAINHAKAAGVEIIVAINKMDKPSANPDRVKQELTEFQLLAEDWGGETICVPVSAISQEGIDTLLEMITLVAEMKELRANPNKNARGVIIEAQLDKGRGPVATVLVQSGTLQVGDPIVAGSAYGKIRAMTDDKGRRVKKAGPSTPVEILGLSEVPTAGDGFYVAESDKQARQVAESIIARNRENLIKDTPQKVSLDDLFSQIQSGNMKELNIVVKADVQGSVEAVRQSLERLTNEEVRVRIIHGGVGAITESDVMLASASNAIIIGFNVRPEPAAKAFADEEKVDVRLYRVIYNAIEDVTAAMKGMLDPVFEEKVLGHAEIRQLFKASGVGTIAGSYVKDGKFVRNCQVRILRDNIVIFEGDLESLKRFKDDVKEVAAGYECGLVFKKFNDLKEGDWVEAFTMVEVPR